MNIAEVRGAHMEHLFRNGRKLYKTRYAETRERGIFRGPTKRKRKAHRPQLWVRLWVRGSPREFWLHQPSALRNVLSAK